MRAYVAVTYPGWLQRLRTIAATEANFWRPGSTRVNQDVGTPWIFKVKGSKLVGGYGFLTYQTVMPVGVAWETFGLANGVGSYAEMLKVLTSLGGAKRDGDAVGCVVLSDLFVLPEGEYIPMPSDWSQHTQQGKYYDLEVGEGARVWAQLTAVAAPPQIASPLLHVPGGFGSPGLYLPRRGQGAFRLMVMDAYERRCAVTGEKTLPALEAAHIRPYKSVESHDVANGILMRSDVHRLFDQGYVTVTPDYRFRVSPRIRDQFHNGLIYYDLHERPIRLPEATEQKPDASALEWHSSKIYRE
jgi:putative restriction endonuclease